MSDRGNAGARAVRASDDDGGGAGASYGVVDHSPTASAAPEWREADPLAPPGGCRRRFLFSACRIGATLELGRSGRAMMTVVVPAPATGSSTTARPHPQHPNGSTPCFRSDFSGWRDAALYPLAAPRAAPDQTITRSFRAGLRTRAVFLRARRTRSRRLAAAVADFFLAHVGSGQRWSSGGQGER